ncbi:four-helix bundle copper-binding protein [Thalassoglobus polymorphus]|nr:four-helix bundle copper-binding protein [Thalassoglobus polymorphus]
MLDEQSDNDCPRCCRECIDLCLLCAQAVARNSRFSEEICRLCADACEWCAEQCGAHDHDHCQKCAEACRACVKSCRSMAQAS